MDSIRTKVGEIFGDIPPWERGRTSLLMIFFSALGHEEVGFWSHWAKNTGSSLILYWSAVEAEMHQK